MNRRFGAWIVCAAALGFVVGRLGIEPGAVAAPQTVDERLEAIDRRLRSIETDVRALVERLTGKPRQAERKPSSGPPLPSLAAALELLPDALRPTARDRWDSVWTSKANAWLAANVGGRRVRLSVRRGVTFASEANMQGKEPLLTVSFNHDWPPISALGLSQIRPLNTAAYAAIVDSVVLPEADARRFIALAPNDAPVDIAIEATILSLSIFMLGGDVMYKIEVVDEPVDWVQ